MKKYSVIIVFLLALIVRIVYAQFTPTIVYNPDSSGYYAIGRPMFEHPTLKAFIQPYRTPLYPLFIQSVFYSFGLGGKEEGSDAYLRGIQMVVVVQMIIGAAAFTIFFHSIRRWFPKWSHRALGIFLLMDVFVIGWERSIFTEGIAVSIALMITVSLLQTMLSPTGRNFLLLFILFTLGFLSRPALLIVPIVTLPILIWYFRHKRSAVILAICTLLASMLIPATYAVLNRINFGYPGIQIVGDIDALGRILETRLPVESARKFTYFYTTVRDYETKNLTTQPFRFLEYYDPAIYGKMDRFIELHKFNQTVLLNTLPQFAMHTVINIPRVLLEVNDYTRVPQSNTIVWLLQQIYGKIQYLTLLVPFMWIAMTIMWIIKPSVKHTFAALLGTMVMSQILLTAAIVYQEIGGQYQRLLLVVRPQMFLFLFQSAIILISRVREEQKAS